MSPQTARKGFVSRYWPVVLWALLIFGISSVPHLSTPAPTFRIIDKIFHCIEFGIFGYLLVSAIAATKTSLSPRRIALAFIIGTLYGFFDEMYQSIIPGRAADPYDAAADALGVLTAIILWIALHRRKSLVS
ncbi:MAG: VanZ family protein [Gemmatimonadota bacterium]|nr:MAG: VanZ family protein [Gemmatimonadota bacterium]